MAPIFSLSNTLTPATSPLDSSTATTIDWNDEANSSQNNSTPQNTDFSQTLQDQSDKYKSHHMKHSSNYHGPALTSSPSKDSAAQTDTDSSSDPSTDAASNTDNGPSAKDNANDATSDSTPSNGTQLDPNHLQSLVAYVNQAQQNQAATATPTKADTSQNAPAPENITPAAGAATRSSTRVENPADDQDPSDNADAAAASTDKKAAQANAASSDASCGTDSDDQNSEESALQQEFPSIKGGAAKDSLKHAAQNTGAMESTPDTTTSNSTDTPISTPSITASITIPLPALPVSDLKTAASSPPTAPAPTVTAVSGTPAQAPSNSATVASTAQQSPASAHENVLDQVIMGLHGKLDPQNGKAEIHLDPPNLGSLRVSINLNKGALTAQFETSTDVVRDLLSTHMDKLRSVLENQGITVDKLAVQTQAEPAQPQSSAQDQRNTGPSNHDGRSAGGYEQNRRGTQQDSNDLTFARTFAQAREEAPIDVLA